MYKFFMEKIHWVCRCVFERMRMFAWKQLVLHVLSPAALASILVITSLLLFEFHYAKSWEENKIFKIFFSSFCMSLFEFHEFILLFYYFVSQTIIECSCLWDEICFNYARQVLLFEGFSSSFKMFIFDQI